MNSLPGVLGLRQLDQELLHPEQGGVLRRAEEVLDEHPVVQLEGKRLHGVVNDHHLAQISTEGAKIFDVVSLCRCTQLIFGKTVAPCDGGDGDYDGDGTPCDGGDGGSGAGTSCGQSAHGEGLVGPVPWKKNKF